MKIYKFFYTCETCDRRPLSGFVLADNGQTAVRAAEDHLDLAVCKVVNVTPWEVVYSNLPDQTKLNP